MSFSGKIVAFILLCYLPSCSSLQNLPFFTKHTNIVLQEGDRIVAQGLQSYHQEHYEVAEAYFESALEKPLNYHPKEEVYVLLGNTNQALAQYEKALQNYQKAFLTNPYYHTALVNQGIVYRLTKDFDKALTCYEQALKIAPNDPHLLTSLGALLAHKKQYEKAVAYFKQSLEIDPHLDISYGNLSYTYAEIGDLENAERFFNLASENGYKNLHPLQEKIRQAALKKSNRP